MATRPVDYDSWSFAREIGADEWTPAYDRPSAIEQVRQLYDRAETVDSPIILDLNGDGVQTVSVDDGIRFDHDGNGFAEQTGWVGEGDGFLVFDRNGNGRIDDGSELFGNNTALANDQMAGNGFAALAELDENGDGKVDSSDAAWQHTQSVARRFSGRILRAI